MAEGMLIGEWASQGAHPELGEIFAAIGRAGAQIARKIRLAGLDDTYGAAGATNVQGEQQQKLDVYANEVLTEALRGCGAVLGIISEEDDDAVVFAGREAGEGAGYVVSFDPLDGSSNIDVNVNVGTIFGIRSAQAGVAVQATVLQPGSGQVAAGYIVYGPSVVFVATVGGSVCAFTLTDGGDFILSARDMRMPEQGPYYSANEANAGSWPPAYRAYLAALLGGVLGGKAYGARYVGSLVADFHRTLLKGGVFLYPPTASAPKGKLRLQYEANPLGMIAEAAGGAAIDGAERILDLRATGIHDRTPLIVGSRREVELLQKTVREARA